MNCVVTACNGEFYESQLVPFLASLSGVAGWRGTTLVIDYGLGRRADLLRARGIQVVAPINRYHLTLDRYFTIAGLAAANPGRYAVWDADVWFTSPIDPLFDHDGRRLVCSADCVYQPTVINCVQPMLAGRCEQVLQACCKKYGNILQCGFMYGASQVWEVYGKFLARMVDSGQFLNTWGTDMAALSYFGHMYPDLVDVIGPAYNCLAALMPAKKDGKFYLETGYLVHQSNNTTVFQRTGREEVRAIHVPTPFRIDKYNRVKFQHNYPELWEEWRRQLNGETQELLNLANLMAGLYDEGAITRYELYLRAREKECWMYLPEAHKASYAEWDASHPADQCLSFCIVA